MLAPALPIRTARLSLRAFTADDLGDLLALQSRADVTTYLPWSPRTAAEVRERLAIRIAETALRAGDDRLMLAVTRAGDGAFLGDVNLWWRSAEHACGEVGWVIHPDHQGRGYATEAAAAMLALGFEGLGLRRIVAECDARNRASARVAEKLGMRLEGRFRQSARVKGAFVDELSFAILAEEWRALRLATGSHGR